MIFFRFSRVRGEHYVRLVLPGVPLLLRAPAADLGVLAPNQLAAAYRPLRLHEPLLPAQPRLPLPPLLVLPYHALPPLRLSFRVLLIQRIPAGARDHIRDARRSAEGGRAGEKIIEIKNVDSKIVLRYLIIIFSLPLASWQECHCSCWGCGPTSTLTGG